MGRLTGKSIVVTGASSGMGNEIVKLFVEEGANVIAVARRKERLEALVESLKDAEGTVIAYPGDVSIRETNEAMIDAAIKHFGTFDVLVNNAGVMDDMSPIGEITDEKFEHVFRVNVYGPMCAMRKAVQTFLARQTSGCIINVASLGGLRTAAGAIYCASKAAVLSMTKNTGYMYAPNGIRCNAIAPGGFETEISNSMGMPNMTGYGRVKNVLATSPAPGHPKEIAYAALFLASDEATYINGETLIVDGGWNAG